LSTLQESFDALLNWLNPQDREAAGEAYVIIRSGLIQTFLSRGFDNAEELTDETIERVTKRVLEIGPTYEGVPAKYFHGVLRNLIKEQRLNKEIVTDRLPERLGQTEKTSRAYDCLVSCLGMLPKPKSELILDYYTYHGSDKIRCHTDMANQMGISENALRMQAYHIRQKLEKCVGRCVEN